MLVGSWLGLLVIPRNIKQYMKRAEKCERQGAAEVGRCRRDPSYRRSSPLLELAAGPSWVAILGSAAARFPGAAGSVLFFPGWTASLLVRLPLVRGCALRMLNFRDSVFFLAGAINEAGGWRVFRREFAMRLPVLCYHHVGTKLPGSWPVFTVPPATFERQIDWLADHGFTGIHAADWLAWMSEGSPLPEKPVLVTFDDGYADLVDKALPVLEARGFKATMFIVSQRIGDASTWDLPLGYPHRPLMTAKEICEASSRGIEIGAHTRTHPDLRILSATELKDEFEVCRRELSELTGSAVNILAYPFGFSNEQVRRCAGEIYELSFGCRPGINNWRSDSGQLRRMFVYPNRFNFAMQVKYGLDLYALWCFVRDRARSWGRCFGLEAGRKPQGLPGSHR